MVHTALLKAYIYMNNGLQKDRSITDGMDMMKAYRDTMKIYRKDCMNTDTSNDTGMNSIYIHVFMERMKEMDLGLRKLAGIPL